MFTSVKAILNAITVSAQAVESVAQTAKNIADTGVGASEIWKESVLSTLSFDDDEEDKEEAK